MFGDRFDFRLIPNATSNYALQIKHNQKTVGNYSSELCFMQVKLVLMLGDTELK